MKQALLSAPEQISIISSEVPLLGENDVLITVDHVGICGSDIHAYYGRHPFISAPIILGHEVAGVVAALGSNAKQLKVGDHVVVEPSLSCGECERCKSGNPHICDRLKVVGCQFPGGFSEYLAVPEYSVIKMREDVPLYYGALVEPLAVGVRACHRGLVTLGSRVCIIGAGTIGMMTAIAAKELGAVRVVLLDISSEKCEKARMMGLESVVNAGANSKELMYELFGEKGPDAIFECVGVQSSVRFGIEGASKGGRIVVVGVFEEDVSIPLALVQDRELELVGTLMYTKDDFNEALEWVSEDKIDVDSFITRVFPLDEAMQAFRFIEEQRGDVLKVMLRP